MQSLIKIQFHQVRQHRLNLCVYLSDYKYKELLILYVITELILVQLGLVVQLSQIRLNLELYGQNYSPSSAKSNVCLEKHLYIFDGCNRYFKSVSISFSNAIKP